MRSQYLYEDIEWLLIDRCGVYKKLVAYENFWMDAKCLFYYKLLS